MELLDKVIREAKQTRLFTIDTESENHGRGALVQIEMVHSIDRSTVLLLEVNHFPHRHSSQFSKIGDLCLIIFNGTNNIFSWGPLEREFKDFTEFPMFQSDKVGRRIDLQSRFSEWRNALGTHPVTEKRASKAGERIDIFDTPSEQESQEAMHGERDTEGNDLEKQHNSLQNAVALSLNLFLDKAETPSRWGCGVDISLDTWKRRHVNQYRHDELEEKQKRIRMRDYAVNDCLAVTRLYFHMDSGNSDTTDSQRTQAMDRLTTTEFRITKETISRRSTSHGLPNRNVRSSGMIHV